MKNSLAGVRLREDRLSQALRSTERLRLKTGRDHKRGEELTLLEPRKAEEKEAGDHRCKDWALKAAPLDQVPSSNNVLESFFPMARAVPLL
jgi:hypothetical protein